MKKLSVFMVFILFSMALSASAQEENVTVQQRGNHYVTLDVSFDRGDIGYWIKMSEKTDIGFNVGLNFRDTQHQKNQNYILTPAIKHYLISDKPFAPYIYSGIYFSYGKGEFNRDFPQSSEDYQVGALGGFGLEWFPIHNVSVGGHVGVKAQYESQNNTSTSFTTSTIDNSTITSSISSKNEGYSVGTFNSGIRLNLFF